MNSFYSLYIIYMTKVTKITPKEKKNGVKLVKETPENAVPIVVIIAEWVRLECESDFIKVVDASGLQKVLKEVNKALDKLTDGKVELTDYLTWRVSGVDTHMLNTNLRY